MCHHIDGDRHRQDENVILPIDNLHAISIRESKPLLRNLSDLFSILRELIFMVKNITLHVQVGSILDIDRPAVSQRSDECLLDRGDLVAVCVFDW